MVRDDAGGTGYEGVTVVQPSSNPGRLAGLLYVLMGIPATFSLVYVPRTLIVRGDAAATSRNILASEMLFRTGIVAELVYLLVFLLLAMALYRLLAGVNKTHASLMVSLVLASVAIGFLNVLNEVAALTLFRGADFLSVFDRRQLDALGMFFLGLYGRGLNINEALWGLWLFPFGVLVIRSGLIPRILGVLLIVNCFAYLAASLTALLLPAYSGLMHRVALIPETGELWIMLWLLIKGARVQPLPAAAS